MRLSMSICQILTHTCGCGSDLDQSGLDERRFLFNLFGAKAGTVCLTCFKVGPFENQKFVDRQWAKAQPRGTLSNPWICEPGAAALPFDW